jgi:dipeptidase D
MSLADSIRFVFELAGDEYSLSGAYSGWTPKLGTPMIKVLEDTYCKLFGKELKITATHGGLECAIMGAKYPNWEMVSIGPTIVHPHSPDERVKIDTVEKAWKFVTAVLENIPEK